MYDTLRKAITATATASRQTLVPTIWGAVLEGTLSEAEGEALAGLCCPAPRPARAVQPRRRPAPRSPDRRASLERRRRCAASGALPPALAASFTTGEAAVLAIIAAEVRTRGAGLLPIDAIAAKSGVCRRTVQNALRAARQAGLISVEERRVARWRNDTNVVCIISTEWLSWLRIGPRGGGCKNLHRTNNSDLKKTAAQPGTPKKEALKSLPRGKTGPPPPR